MKSVILALALVGAVSAHANENPIVDSSDVATPIYSPQNEPGCSEVDAKAQAFKCDALCVVHGGQGFQAQMIVGSSPIACFGDTAVRAFNNMALACLKMQIIANVPKSNMVLASDAVVRPRADGYRDLIRYTIANLDNSCFRQKK